MPSHFILHEGNTLSFYGMGNDTLGLSMKWRIHSFYKALQIMSIHKFKDFKSKGMIFNRQIPHVHDLFCFSIDLKLVVIHKQCKIAELIVPRRHGSLPHLTFLMFPISKDAVNLCSFTGESCSKGHAHGYGYPLSQGTCGSIKTSQLLLVRMSLKGASELTEGGKKTFVKITKVSKSCIKRWCCVSFGEHKAVSLWVLRVF